MKNLETIKSIVLTILVVISLVLTYFQWIYQPGNEEKDLDNLVEPVKIAEERALDEVIVPTQVLFHRSGETYGTGNISNITDMYSDIKKWDFSEIVEYNPGDNFLNLVHGNGRVEFIFDSDVSLQLFSRIQGFSEDNVPDRIFDRMVLDMGNYDGNNLTVYFVKYFGKERKVYKTNASGAAIKQFQDNYYYQNPEGFYAYKYYDVDELHRVYYPINENRDVTIYGYNVLTNEVETDLFRDALFSQPDNVSRTWIEGGREYKDSSSLMRVDNSRNELFYVNPANKPDTIISESDIHQRQNGTETTGSETNIHERSIEYINNHAGWTDQYIYTSWVENKISFMLYYQGYPVYSEDIKTTIDIIWGEKGIYKYNRPDFDIKIRLGDETEKNEPTVTELPSGDYVIETLLQQQLDPKDLQALRIGYKLVQESKGSVITLKPTWLYLYAGNWLSITFGNQGGDKIGLE